MSRPSALARTALAALLSACVLPARSQEIGTAGAVNPATTGTPPSRPSRVLELGSRVVFKERITTSAVGTAQIIFTDKSTLNLGPNSAVVIDEYVYDPGTGSGRMAATLTRGLLRFVGGATSHTGGAQITTPTATIGIRGGVMTGRYENGETRAVLHYGKMSVSSEAGRQDVSRPGFGVTVQSAGAPPSAPARVTSAELAAVNAQLTSKPGQSGGRQPVTPAAVADAAQAAPTIGRTTTSVPSLQSQTAARQVSTSESIGLSTAPTDATSPTQIQQVSSNINRQVTTQNQQEAAVEIQQQQTAASTGNQNNAGTNTPTPAPPPPTARAFALQMGRDPSLSQQAPYLRSEFVAPGTFRNSPVLGYGVGGNNADGTPNTTRRVLQAGLNINGQGTNQTSTIYVMVGNSFQSTISGQPTFSGGFTATSRLSPTAGFPGRSSGGFVGNGANVTFDGDYVPTSITGRPGSTGTNDEIIDQTATFFRGDGSPSVEYQFSQTATAIGTPANLGANRPTVQLSGVANGLMRTVNRSSGASENVVPFSGNVSFPLDGTVTRFGSVITGSTSETTPKTLRLPFGFQGDGTQTGRGTYVDYDNFAGRESRASGVDGAFLAQVNGQAVSQHRGLIVTSQTVDAASFFTNTAFCQCEYTRWGFWSSETQRSANGSNFQDLLHLGTWVAGQPTAIGSIPFTGTATYAGHVIGTIQSNQNQYTAASNMTNTVNFATRTGTVAVPNFDGRSYTGTITLQNGANQFGGTLTATGANMAMIGQFGKGASGPAGEIFGGVSVNGGANYFGNGIFAARSP